MTDELHYLGLLEVATRIRCREISSVEVVSALIERIERYDSQLHSILLRMNDTAMQAARRADAEIAAGQWRGPLHGVPIAIKDLLWTEGLPTTGGMAFLRDFRPPADATVVKRLKAAGAVLIAKAHTTEGATYMHHPSWQRPVNPWSAEHWTGVSSSGSGAAVAAGFCYGALGTDTGGSIRLPSAANNLSGIKPTWGRVSRQGLLPLSESLDHIGPMARSVADAAAILQVIAGADADDPTALLDPVPGYSTHNDTDLRGITIGIDWNYATDDMPEPVVIAVRNAVQVFTDLGARIQPVEFPQHTGEIQQAFAILTAEAGVAHAEHFPAKEAQYGSALRAMLMRAREISAADLAQAYQARDRFTGRLRALFDEVDLLLMPGMGELLPTWSSMDFSDGDMARMQREHPRLAQFTSPFNLAGSPTLSFPGGFTTDDLPIGLQLAAWKLNEPLLIRAGMAFQRATDFHTRHPTLR